jgi:chemotaxis protein methyltransferase CheR
VYADEAVPTTAPFPSVVCLLRSLVEERLGLRYADADLPNLLDRIEGRARAVGSRTLLEYYNRLRGCDDDMGPTAEWLALADHLVTTETYFFRETAPLETLIEEEVVPRLRRGLRLRLWSAGCATGEEPLTLAVLLAERHCLDQVVLWASDISPGALARARTGRYPASALRLPALPEAARRWMTRQPDGSIEVAPELVARVHWQPVNLLAGASVNALGVFDIVLCRNVLIYFSDRATRAVVTSLTEALRPGGVLITGVSESLQRFSPSLTCEEHHGAFYYRRPETPGAGGATP